MEKPCLLCIAHRGAMGHAPENTLASIRKALALGARCIEVDVYYVAGHLMVFHDDRLERTTNGKGYLAEQTFQYLRSLDAGDGQQIPVLEEVCDLIAGKAGLNIELKGADTELPVAALLSRLLASGWSNNAFLVSSFDYRRLVNFKAQLPAIKLGVLTRGRARDIAKLAQDLAAYSVHPSRACVNQRFVDDAHNRGLKVFVFAVDDSENIDKMYRLGVDGVFTGFPERVLEKYAQPDIFNADNKK